MPADITSTIIIITMPRKTKAICYIMTSLCTDVKCNLGYLLREGIPRAVSGAKCQICLIQLQLQLSAGQVPFTQFSCVLTPNIYMRYMLTNDSSIWHLRLMQSVVSQTLVQPRLALGSRLPFTFYCNMDTMCCFIINASMIANIIATFRQSSIYFLMTDYTSCRPYNRPNLLPL